MMRRCTDPQHPSWHNYGGRGIQVHPDWMDDPHAFYAYLDALGDCPEGHSLDRIDNDGNYEPGNLRWADKSTQRKNARSQYVNLK